MSDLIYNVKIIALFCRKNNIINEIDFLQRMELGYIPKEIIDSYNELVKGD